MAYVWPLVFGTLLSAAIALLIATPLAIGIALFISHYAPRRLAAALGYLVDLLAAVPSVIFGLWGIVVLAPRVGDAERLARADASASCRSSPVRPPTADGRCSPSASSWPS